MHWVLEFYREISFLHCTWTFFWILWKKVNSEFLAMLVHMSSFRDICFAHRRSVFLSFLILTWPFRIVLSLGFPALFVQSLAHASTRNSEEQRLKSQVTRHSYIYNKVDDKFLSWQQPCRQLRLLMMKHRCFSQQLWPFSDALVIEAPL